jgi:homoserine kinase
MEGHPDNVAACLLGGATLSYLRPDGAAAVRMDVDPRVLPVVLVPEATLATHVARGLLPDVVPHADAAANAGRAALLVRALTAEPGLLFDATEDRLHQRQRSAAMPGSWSLLERLRDAGHAAVVSGAGPSLLVLAERRPGDPTPLGDLAGLVPAGWRVMPLEVDPEGARVVHAIEVSS